LEESTSKIDVINSSAIVLQRCGHLRQGSKVQLRAFEDEALNTGATKLPSYVPRAIVISFVLQVAAIAILHTYRFRTTDNHFAFGWEMGCIGRALALGRGFSDPFCVPTGPSAWEPPLYPFLIGAVFSAFGIYSKAAAWVLLITNSAFASLTCIPVYFIARRIFFEPVAKISVWTWALLPYTWYWSIHWVWDTTISPFLLACIVWLGLELEVWDSLKGWLWFGLLSGVAALLNPSLLSFLPFAGLWIWYRRHRRGAKSFTGIVFAAAAFAVCLFPWLSRNYSTFGRLVFIRDDFGQQLRLGNGPGATGISMVNEQPNLNAAELERFQRMGELSYAEQRKHEAYNFIRENPGHFAVLSIKRFVYYWMGLPKNDEPLRLRLLRNSVFLASSVLALLGAFQALRRSRPGASLLAWLIFSYPAVYYFVYPHARYRHPIEPELVILIVFALCPSSRRNSETGTSAPAL
jgi:4-amino-4-deoxy-L-arabinose transferase-like glycosyltransferase